MRKWRSLANPCDSSAWLEISNFWPTGRGSYEVADVYGSAAAISATGEEGAMISAWAFNGLSSARAYYIGKYIWELNSGLSTATDRTGALGASAVSSTTGGHACQYGDVTIVTRGTGASLIYSTGANFAALAASPAARFVVVQSNCVVAFNTSASADTWVASDVGDYTNWTTGEAANGRILENNGPITGAIPWGNDIIVFKADAIFRMTYVGGTIKWQIQKIWNGYGLPLGGGDGGSAVCATDAGLFFAGGASYSTGRQAYYLFDGTSPPRQINLETDVQYGVGVPVYDPKTKLVHLTVQRLVATGDYRTYVYTYSLTDDAWGAYAYIGFAGASDWYYPLRGDAAAVGNFTGGLTPARPLFRGTTTANDEFYKKVASTPGTVASSAYVKTHKFSGPQSAVFGEAQWTFGPAAPVLRRRSTYSAGSPALALTVDTFTEAHDTTAAATASVTESTIRDRFDFTKADSFCQLKLTATDTDIEIDDISLKIVAGGRR